MLMSLAVPGHVTDTSQRLWIRTAHSASMTLFAIRSCMKARGAAMRATILLLVVFDAAENHSVHALDENLIFVSFLHGIPTTRPGKVGGELGREEERQTGP